MSETGERNVFVLSGGGPLGAAQVGMLHGLLDQGVAPDALVGCSVGALNAAVLAVGPLEAGLATLTDTWLSLRRTDIFPSTPLAPLANVLRGKEYLFSSARLGERLDAWFDCELIEDLARPLRIVTTDLGTGSTVYHDTGSLRAALLASTAVPGVFPSVELRSSAGGRPSPHVDGGVSALVPVAGSLDLQPTRVYVLDVATRPPSGGRIRSPLDMLVRSLDIAVRLPRDAPVWSSIDVTVIRCPELSPLRVRDFSQTRALMAAGERAACEALGTPWTAEERAYADTREPEPRLGRLDTLRALPVRRAARVERRRTALAQVL